MPTRKEPKEPIVYQASKRKAPPFKPQRPSQVPRVSTTAVSSAKPKMTARPSAFARRKTPVAAQNGEDDDDEDEDDDAPRRAAAHSESSGSDEELDENPLATKSKAKSRKSTTTKPAPARRKPSRQASPVSVSSEQQSRDGSPTQPSRADSPPPAPSQSDLHPTIPQALLVRLLHEHFADKETKIDKHAIQIVQKYFEVFVREAVARAQLQKKEEAGRGAGDRDVDVNWLELEDLEKIAAGMALDF